MRFKVFLDTAQGLVTNIVVQAKRRRDGWADAMVRALIELYPGRTWTVEAPIEQSGQLFVKLASRLRGTVVAPVEDTTLPIDATEVPHSADAVRSPPHGAACSLERRYVGRGTGSARQNVGVDIARDSDRDDALKYLPARLADI